MRQIRKRLSNKFRWPFFFCDNFCLEYMKSVLNDYLCTKKSERELLGELSRLCLLLLGHFFYYAEESLVTV